MSLAQAVAALPGGGEFAALWTQVDGDPGAITDVVSKIKSTAAKAEDSAHHISKASGEVGDAWHGHAASAFKGYMHHFGAAASSVHAAMDKAATALEQAASAVETAKHHVNSIASRILDRAHELEKLKAHPATAPLYEAGVRQAVQEGCAEAAPVVKALTSHLEQAASTVRSAVHSGGFVAMKAADSGTYLPAKGKPIQWSPVPKGSDATSSQSAGGSGGSGGGGGSSSGGGSGVSSSGSSSGGAPAAMPTGNVKQWIEEAKEILLKHGYKASQLDEAGINMIIQHESSGNPHIQNDWDSNAAAGHPSKGLMQTIDSTFDAHSLPGHKDIWNPVDNIIAGVRYAISRYGSISNVPGVYAVNHGGSYVGY